MWIVSLTHTTYLNIVTDKVHPFMETAFPNGGGLFQQENPAEVAQEWSGAQHRGQGVGVSK